MGREDETFVTFQFDEIQSVVDDSGGKCRLIFITEATYQLAISCLRYASPDFVNTRLKQNKDQGQADDASRAIFIGWYEKALEELTMDCNDDLSRIADALEGLNAKAGAFYSVQDFLDDLADTLGVGSTIYQFLDAVWGLFPRLKLKVDATPLALSAWEYLTFKGPIVGAAVSIASAQGVIAASAAGSAIWPVISGISGFWTNFFFNAQQLALGNTDLWDDWLKPIWSLFGKDSDDGTGGDDPDNRADLRPIVNVSNTQIVSSAINALCCELATATAPDIGTADNIVNGDTLPVDGSSGDDPSNQFVDYDLGYIGDDDDDKCSAAEYLVDAVIEIFGYEDWQRLIEQGISNNVNVALATATLIVASLTIGVPITYAAIVLLVAALITGQLRGIAGLLGSISATVASDREGYVCILYSAPNTNSARSGFLQKLRDDGLDEDLVNLIPYVLSNNVLNLLFWASSTFATEGYGTLTCSTLCVEEGTHYVAGGQNFQEHGGGQFSVSGQFAGSFYWAQVHLNAAGPDNITGPFVEMQTDSLVGHSTRFTSGCKDFQLFLSDMETAGCSGSDPGELVYNETTIWTGNQCVSGFAIYSTTPFTFAWTEVDECTV